MKMVYQSGKLTFEAEISSGKQAFEVAAKMAELFEETHCGCCKSEHIRHEVREYDGNSYYKMLCNDCGAQLDFGQKKDGKSLFAKRYDSEAKQALPNRGWYVWHGEKKAKPAQTETSYDRDADPENVPF